jgi:hypothetical protein
VDNATLSLDHLQHVSAINGQLQVSDATTQQLNTKTPHIAETEQQGTRNIIANELLHTEK